MSFYWCYHVAQDTKETALHAAVRKKDVEIAKILVESGCALDTKNVS